MTENGRNGRLAQGTVRTFVNVLIVIWSLLFSQAFGEIYRWVDKDGVLHFGDRPPPEVTIKKVEVKVNTYESVEVHYNPDMFDKGVKKKRGVKRVLMYSAQWCGVCAKAKSHFRKKKIPFQELDIDQSDKARRGFEKLNGKGVPIILVGNQRMNGFNPERFDKMYAGTRSR